MTTHNPLQFASSLSAKLATRSRHVCAFLGAGVGKACGLPDVNELQQRVLEDLEEENQIAFQFQLENRNLEETLSRLRRISSLLSGEEEVDGLTAKTAHELDAAICKIIVRALSVEITDPSAAIYLAAWAARANYHLPIELFTVNYDLLLEIALENMRVPYFDGFIGTLEARFHTDLVEELPGSVSQYLPPFFVRLWKLHGSVNWTKNNEGQILRLGNPVSDGRAIAIYPSDTKYEESRRVPFVVLQDRLRRALHQPETLMLITGYSFSDDHLNEQIFHAATHRERSEFIVFCHSKIPAILAEHASITPNIQVVSRDEAIIGGVKAKWETKENGQKGIWEEGSFSLCDFKNLAKYLARSSTHQYEHQEDSEIRKLIHEVLGKPQNETAGKDND